MSDPRVIWSFSGSSFFQLVSGEYAGRFDGKFQYTKDLVLGATTAAQSYIDLGAFEVAPLSMRIEFETNAARQTFQGLIGITATLSNTLGISYTAMLVDCRRVENGGMYLCDAVWEQR